MIQQYALFPFKKVERDSKVAIYGIGRAGLNFMRQAAGYCTVVFFVDKDKAKHSDACFGLEKLLDLDAYDCVVVSPMSFPIRNRIRDELIAFGVPEGKIILPDADNLLYWQLDGLPQLQKEAVADSRNDPLMADARSLVTSKRLDIGIKWLLLRDAARSIENPDIVSLYARHILAWTGGKESPSRNSAAIREGVGEYIKTARDTLKSIRSNGYDSRWAVPVNEENVPLDGMHRIASCIELDAPLWVKRYPGLETHIKDWSWYQSNGFSLSDQMRILGSFIDLYQGACSIALLYGPALDQWSFMQKQLENKFNVVGYIDLDFESNYLAFEQIINDIYFYKFTYRDHHIDAKISLLKLAPLKIRVLVLSDEYDKSQSQGTFFGKMRAAKLGLREASFAELDQAELQIHTTDDAYETGHLRRVLLSPNNLKYASYRLNTRYAVQFIERLDKLKALTLERNVALENVCIVNSSVLEVLGIRESVKDIDFICRRSDAGKLADISFESNAIELRNNLMEMELLGIDSESIVENDSYHFIFHGIKFCNLEFVRAKKAEHGRAKDLRDIRLIDLFTELAHVFDYKVALQKGVYEEMQRRRLN